MLISEEWGKTLLMIGDCGIFMQIASPVTENVHVLEQGLDHSTFHNLVFQSSVGRVLMCYDFDSALKFYEN